MALSRSGSLSSLAVIVLLLIHPCTKYHGNGTWVFFSHTSGSVEVLLITINFRRSLLNRFFSFKMHFSFFAHCLSLGPSMHSTLNKRLNHNAPHSKEQQC